MRLSIKCAREATGEVLCALPVSTRYVAEARKL
jgi:hypothetical protein